MRRESSEANTAAMEPARNRGRRFQNRWLDAMRIVMGKWVASATVRRRGWVTGTAVIAGACAVVLLFCAPAFAASHTTTFGYTGGEQTFVVPAGVSSVTVSAVGGAGGGAPGWGGEAASVSGTVAVSPGETLYVEVGGAGRSPTGNGVLPGGFNGGGAGGSGQGTTGQSAFSGGGASDVRTVSIDSTGSLDSRLIVAAGGGGGGAPGSGYQPGQGGDAGSPGHNGPDFVYAGGGGGAGTQTAGGNGGGPGSCCGRPVGAMGQQGAGGDGGLSYGGGGGGGAGGGLYGGGGGGPGDTSGGGGGGGSSLVPPNGSLALTTDPAQVQLSYDGAAFAPVQVIGQAVSATEGQQFTGQVASFSDADSQAAGDYSASIDWGDGSTTQGTVAQTAPGQYSVSGTHSYTDEGSHPVKVTVSDSDTASGQGSGTATVADASLSAGQLTLSAGTEGAQPAKASFGFADANPAASASDYSATIDWGDGSTSTVTVSASGGGFIAAGSHTYAEEGSYQVSVTVTDAGGQSTGATGTAAAADAALTAQGVSLQAVSRQPFTRTVATFTDANPGQHAGDFTATIGWGDGSSSSGTVSYTNGSYSISGSHTYAKADPHGQLYPITMTITDAGGQTTTAASSSDVDHKNGKG